MDLKLSCFDDDMNDSSDATAEAVLDSRKVLGRVLLADPNQLPCQEQVTATVVTANTVPV